MEDSLRGYDIEEVENTLCQIGEVKAARIVTGENNAIEEIHVLAAPTKGPKQLVRDIESVLMAQYGLSINHRKISIAQVGAEEEVAKPKARPKIASVSVEVTGVRARVKVLLEVDGEEYEGEAEGLASQTGRLRLVAYATLDAVEKFAKTPYGFALEDVSVVLLGRERVAVACVTMVTPLGEQGLCGSAIVRQNEKDSIVRATLDAINRRFGFLTTA